MWTWGDRLSRLHRFMASQSFYALSLCSALCIAFFAGRVYLSRNGTFAFLVWNLILAWVPYLCSMLAIALFRRQSLRFLIVLPALLWLLFLPNAPYLLTDLRHRD